MLPMLQVPPKEGRQIPSRLFHHALLRKTRERKQVLPTLLLFVFFALSFIIYSVRCLTLTSQDATQVHTRSGPQQESPPFSSDRQQPYFQVLDDDVELIDLESNDQYVFSEDAAVPTYRPDLDDALDYVINLMPDELESQYILQQVATLSSEPDEKALKTLGLLVRKYSKLYTAWEDLHVVRGADGGSYVYDDVIQYLRYSSADSFSDDRDKTDAAAKRKIHVYESFRHFVTKLGQSLFPWTAPYHAEHMAFRSTFATGGRGIVLTAGSHQAAYLLTSIPTLRQLGCNLPIEIMYLGDTDLREDLRAKLEALDGVLTRDVSLRVNPVGWTLGGWAIKPFAMLLSSFREIIFIDADSLFFQNPEILFDDPDYTRTGALFFLDRHFMPENKQEWLRKLLPKPISDQVKTSRPWVGSSGHMQESGVIVVDKWRHFVTLLLVAHLNGPLSKGVYKMVYGDKETFWLGWELAGNHDYAFHQGATGNMGILQEMHPSPTESNDSETRYEICSPQLLHLDTSGNPLWFNGWIAENKFEESKKNKVASFEHFVKESDDPNKYWKIQPGNVFCLWGLDDKIKALTAEEKQILEIIADEAKKANAITPV